MFVGGICAMEALPWGRGHGGAWQLSVPCKDGSCSRQCHEPGEEPLALHLYGYSGWKLLHRVAKMTALLAENCNLGLFCLSGISAFLALCELVTVPHP